jgi:hypothetical protein
MENNFYVYMYLREDGTPYYVGKGKKRRAYSKEKRVLPPKDESRIVFYKQNLTEEEAFEHEIELIALYGRKDLGTGILHNLTDGGEGSSGIIISEETRRKLSKSLKGRVFSEEHRKKISENCKGKIFSEEHKRKISENAKNRPGRPLSEETRKKISERLKGKIVTEETRRKMSEANRARTHSEETRRKQSVNIREALRQKKMEKMSSCGTGLEKFFE